MFAKNFSILLLFLCLNSLGFSQNTRSKQQLELEKISLQKKISEAKKILNETKIQQQASVGELNALNNLITINEEYSNTINKEISLIRNDISGVKSRISKLNVKLDTLRFEYAQMLYSAQKALNNREQILFLFSSNNYHQLNQRIKYLEMVREVRKRQFDKINAVKIVLEEEETILQQKTKQKQKALTNYEQEKTKLDALGTEQKKTIQSLEDRESDIKQEISDYQKRQEKIDKLINDIIKKEIERKRKLEANKKAEAVRLASLKNKRFESNKGQLSWPVKKSFISQKFGLQNHPTIPGIKVNNPGINLQTSKGSEVKAVFSGTIMTVAAIPGAGKLVMVSHGDYYTVYSKLATVNVKKGDELKLHQTVGIVMTDTKGVTELGFQVWKETNKENPENWLK